MAGAAGAIMFTSSGAGGLLLPVLLATPNGSNNGEPYNASATGFGILCETSTSSVPSLISGAWTSIATASYSTAIYARLSYKLVTNGESVDPAASRSNLRIYSNVNAADPIDDVQTTNGTSALNLPALTISAGGRLVVAFTRAAGATAPAWAAPINQNTFVQGASAMACSAESAGLLSSYAGQSISISNNDHVAFVLALNGA